MLRRRLVLVPTLGSLLGLTLVVAPTVRAPSSAPPAVQVSSASVSAADKTVGRGWSKVVDGDPNLVGVRWQGDPNASFTIETRDDRGRWTIAGAVARPDGGPDRQSSEARRARPGNVSEPLWVGDATAVRVRVAGGSARAIDLEQVKVPRAPTSANVAAAAVGPPAIYTRAQWGANENLRLANCPGDPDYDDKVVLAIVHHTGGSNNYGPGDTPAIMRGLYAYATQTLQYCDIHYNFLVDKYGQVFEGRYGGMDRAVHGAHSVGFNTNTTGIAAIGNFQTTPAPPAMMAAIQRLIAWKFDVQGVNPYTRVTYVTAGNDKFAPGTAISEPRIIGHQDTWFTDCPGVYIEPQLPAMGLSVASTMSTSRQWGPWYRLGAALVSAPATSSWGPDRLDLFGRTGSGIVHKWGNGFSWTTDWENVGAPPGGLTGSPTAVSWGPNRIDLFATGTDGSLRHRFWLGAWSDWEDLGGNLTSSPTVASWGPNRLDVFGTGPRGTLVHKWWDNRWSSWETLGGGVVGDPAAVSWGNNRVDVFVRGTDNALWHRWYVGGWTSWEGLGGILSEAPSAATWRPDRVDIFVRGSDNALWHKWWDGAQWLGYEPLGGVLLSKPSAFAKSWNRLDVSVRGTDNQLWHRAWG